MTGIAVAVLKGMVRFSETRGGQVLYALLVGVFVGTMWQTHRSTPAIMQAKVQHTLTEQARAKADSLNTVLAEQEPEIANLRVKYTHAVDSLHTVRVKLLDVQAQQAITVQATQSKVDSLVKDSVAHAAVLADRAARQAQYDTLAAQLRVTTSELTDTRTLLAQVDSVSAIKDHVISGLNATIAAYQSENEALTRALHAGQPVLAKVGKWLAVIGTTAVVTDVAKGKGWIP